MKVKKKYLLIIASVVWLVAGFNVLRIGTQTYQQHLSLLNYLLSVLVFIPFSLMFYKISKKNHLCTRVYQDEYQYFYRFFDLKSFIIMAFMIILGIVLRKFELVSTNFIVIFYTGLGAALFMASICFMYYFILENKINYEEVL